MAIPAGTRLGPYEICTAIGAGGMGEVYEARDTKLGRSIAIKVLSAAFANDPERLARFQREAKMLASVNHPNIATVHGLEESGGRQYLVMELVAGETLADRVKARPVPVEEALKIAVQIAEALEAAHEKNIIHRDLKPANVKVTPEGKVKVLDFGLAKAFAGDTEASDPTNSPTLSMAATMQGVILGTAAYMSPEQARGKATDKRTDIWAFGCVLYEMLTGKQAFPGETATDIIAKVLQNEPAWQMLPLRTPAPIRNLLRRCLQKDKTLRMRDAGDARIEIQEALTAPVGEAETAAVPQPVARWRRAAGSGLLGLALLGVGAIATWNLKPARPQPVTRAVISLPLGQQLAGLENGAAVALSPDGTRLAYVARQAGVQQLYTRSMDSLETVPVPGTQGASAPFFSPDGQWLGFFAQGKLKKIQVTGGLAQTLGDVADPGGASWSSLGTVAFAPSRISVLHKVSDTGGAPQPLTRLDKGEAAHRWPSFLPSGSAMLFAAGTASGNWSSQQIAIQLLATGQRRNLVQKGMYPSFAASGHLVYAQGGTLMAVSFDPRRLEVSGTGVPIVEGVSVASTGAAQYSFSATGSLVYVPGSVQSAQSRLVWVDRKGAEQVLPGLARGYVYPRLSPDGRKVAVGITGAEQEIYLWVYDLVRETSTRLTFQGGSTNYFPVWAPDGTRIAFESNKEGPLNLFWQPADGSGEPERLTTSEYTHNPMSWTPDGRLLAFSELNPVTGFDLWVLRLTDRKALPFLQTAFNESAPRFSPDGHWLAYASDESGRQEIYVLPYPGPGGKWQISTEGGREPVWNPNGKELFYRSGERMMAVDITTNPSFAAGKPHSLFDGPYALTVYTAPNYDVSPDGKRFLMLKPVEQDQAALTQINVVLNWFEELKRRVPTGK